jgi:peptidyl-prolyl cis-trans isomerase C
MFLIARTSAAVALAMAFTAPLAAQDAPAGDSGDAAKELSADTVLAEVNGETITLGHIIALVKDLPDQYQQLPDDVLFPGALDQMVQQLVLSQTFADPTKVEEMAIANQERALRAGLAVQRILSEDISDADLQAAYDQMFQGEAPDTEYHAAHILVDTEDEAKTIVDELKAGGDFAAIAKEKSKDPGSGANGGDLGWFSLGVMVPEFENAVVALEPGQISDPIQTQFGWHVIRLTETRVKALPTLDDMRDQLTDQIRNDKVQAAIDAAMAGAAVDRSGSEGMDPAVIRRTDLLED